MKNIYFSPKIKNSVIAAIIVIFTAVMIYNNGSRECVSNIPEPIQEEADGGTFLDKRGYHVAVNYKYSYEIEALVVHTHNYYGLSLGDALAPKDVALAWGNVARYNTQIDFHWAQSGRWYRWHTKSYEEIAPVGGEDGVNRCSSNNHLIAADSTVKSAIRKIRRGDHVRITGYLSNIYATKSNGTTFTWSSSTTREDTGDGSCEVIYVTKVEFLD